jgi:hypothetical protein
MLPRFGKSGGSQTGDNQQLPPGLRGGRDRPGRKGR